MTKADQKIAILKERSESQKETINEIKETMKTEFNSIKETLERIETNMADGFKNVDDKLHKEYVKKDDIKWIYNYGGIVILFFALSGVITLIVKVFPSFVFWK